jgi:hypothetical protein
VGFCFCGGGYEPNHDSRNDASGGWGKAGEDHDEDWASKTVNHEAQQRNWGDNNGSWGGPDNGDTAEEDQNAEFDDEDPFFCDLTFKTSQLKVSDHELYGSDYDLTPILLSHAQLVVFSDSYRIDGLKQLALKKLHEELRLFPLHDDRVGDIVMLFRYAFSEGQDIPADRGLRWLVKQYILWVGHHLVGYPGFRDFLNDMDKDLSVDLFSAMAKRHFNQYNHSGTSTPLGVYVPS